MTALSLYRRWDKYGLWGNEEYPDVIEGYRDDIDGYRDNIDGYRDGIEGYRDGIDRINLRDDISTAGKFPPSQTGFVASTGVFGTKNKEEMGGGSKLYLSTSFDHLLFDTSGDGGGGGGGNVGREEYEGSKNGSFGGRMKVVHDGHNASGSDCDGDGDGDMLGLYEAGVTSQGVVYYQSASHLKRALLNSTETMGDLQLLVTLVPKVAELLAVRGVGGVGEGGGEEGRGSDGEEGSENHITQQTKDKPTSHQNQRQHLRALLSDLDSPSYDKRAAVRLVLAFLHLWDTRESARGRNEVSGDAMVMLKTRIKECLLRDSYNEQFTACLYGFCGLNRFSGLGNRFS